MFRLFHVSDIHFGAEDQSALDWFKRCVHSEKPDAVALTGDITMRARHREFDAACDWILSLDVPVTVEIGNHDMPYFNPIERLVDPYRRFRRIEKLVERELDLPNFSIIPLKTTARAQWRTNWSKGIVSAKSLKSAVDAIRALPDDQLVFVAAHHPLVEAGTRGQALTRGGNVALATLAGLGVHAVLSGHVHDPFDLVHETDNGPIRMIGAGTLSQRTRSTPPSFNELHIHGRDVEVIVRNLERVATPDMMINAVPENALAQPGEPIAPVAATADPSS